MSQTPDFVLGDDFARVLTETTMSLVCVLGEDGRILFFNQACERLTGFTRAEAVGRDARELVIPPEEAEAFGEVLAYIWKTGLASPGRALADERRRAETRCLVEQADARRGRRIIDPGDGRNRSERTTPERRL